MRQVVSGRLGAMWVALGSSGGPDRRYQAAHQLHAVEPDHVRGRPLPNPTSPSLSQLLPLPQLLRAPHRSTLLR